MNVSVKLLALLFELLHAIQTASANFTAHRLVHVGNQTFNVAVSGDKLAEQPSALHTGYRASGINPIDRAAVPSNATVHTTGPSLLMQILLDIGELEFSPANKPVNFVHYIDIGDQVLAITMTITRI